MLSARKKQGIRKNLTEEEREEVKNLYRYRLLALKEAAQFTQAKIAERFGCCHNTIWYTTRDMELPDDFDKTTVVDRLERKIAELEYENKELKRDVFKIELKRKSIIEKIKAVLI